MQESKTEPSIKNQTNGHASPLSPPKNNRDYQFIDLVAALHRAVAEGLVSRLDRTVSQSYAGWQVWLPKIEGVFELLLKSHEPEALMRGTNTVAQYFRTDLLLKYYPDPGEEVFQTFSLYERILRQSEIFDGQPVPGGEIKVKLHETYFTVAEITLALARDHHAAALCLRTQDQWREIRGSPLSVRGPDGRLWRLPVDSVDRRVPGWKISMNFFVPLVKAYTLRHGSPQLLYLSEFKGKIWNVTGKATESRLSSRVMEKRLDVGFVDGSDMSGQKKRQNHLRLYFAQFSAGRIPLRERRVRNLDRLMRAI